MALKNLVTDAKQFWDDFRSQDFAIWAVCAYLIFSYLKPQATFPVLNFLPWIQISILAGLGYLTVKGRLRFQIIHFSMLLFFFVVLNSLLFAYNPDEGWSKFNVIYIQLLEMLFFTSCLVSVRQFHIVVIVLFLILFKMSFFGAKTWVMRGFGFRNWGIAGPDGFFANSGEFSLLMAIFGIISLGYLMGRKDARRIYFLFPITAIMTVLGASSRGSQLAIAIGLLAFMWFLGRLSIKNMILIGLIGFIGFSLLPEEQKERFQTMGEDDTSQSRLTYWKAGLDMLSENKLSGVGFFGFAEYFQDHYKSDMEDGYLASRKEVAHNSLIESSSELGYPGVICYLWFHLLCFLLNRKSGNLARESKLDSLAWVPTFSLSMNIGVLVYFIGAFFMSVSYYPYIYLLMMLSQSLLNVVNHTLANSTGKTNAKKQLIS